MAKLQQKMETTKQNSQILLIGGYVTMNGKRYDECVPFEREAFNEALHIVRGGKKRTLPVNVFTMTKENYTPSGKVSKAMFDCEYYDLQFSDEQIDVLTDLLNEEYQRLDKEAEEERRTEIMDELVRSEERKSYNFSQYGFLNI